jgi:predicted flap endonuclease-1-like 5' DNA nuclease
MENFTSDLLFIIIVLVGAAILGFLIGYFVNARYKKLIAAIDDLKAEMDKMKKKIADHSHEVLGKELSDVKSKLSEIDERTRPAAFNPEQAEKIMGKKIKENDLTIIEGIGAKIAEMLNKHKISTWQELAKSTAESLKAVLLKEGGNSFAVHDPTSWPAQAGMAWEGKWELLKEFQDYLVGGVSPEK